MMEVALPYTLLTIPNTMYTAYTLYTALVLTQCYTGLYITLWSEQAL